MNARLLRILLPVLTVCATLSAAPSVTGVPLDDIQKRSAEIDRILAKAWAEKGERANGSISNEIFLRRAYLRIVGRIPTLEEAVRFLQKPDRATLIDELLDSDGYVSHNFNRWADRLRILSDPDDTQLPSSPYLDYVKKSLKANKPYDKWVHEMLTAEGYEWENGAAGYWMRDFQMPLDAMSNTIQLFLGTQIQCAQCHDHPFDKWTQREFYEVAAFTYGVQTRNRDMLPKGVKEYQDLKKGNDTFNQVGNGLGLNDFDRQVAVKDVALKLPHNYKYKDGKPGDTIEPLTLFGDSPKFDSGAKSRVQAFASWVTNPKTPRFATVVSNRLWKDAFGRGLMEPVDDLTDDSKADIPELMDYLSEQMIDLKFDLKQYLRMIYNTKAFEQASAKDDLPNGEPYYFTGPILQRMSAEQFWDSVVTLIIPDPDKRQGYDRGDYRLGLMKKHKNMSGGQLFDIVKKAAADRDRMMMMGRGDGRAPNDGRWNGYDPGITRASELPSPAPLGHFLRQFGQSERASIDGAIDDPNISQVLETFNGYMFEQVTDNNAMVWRNLEKFEKSKVQALFISVLSRKPSSAESRYTGKVMQLKSEREGQSALIWALLNTRQFSFIQ